MQAPVHPDPEATSSTSANVKAPTAGRVLVESLRRHGVDRVFCVPGESYLEVLDALHDVPEIELVVAKHEGGAANMAEADGKLTGRPGICMVTRGPGATQASIGVHIAQQDSTPMILFVGQISRGMRGRDVFQEVDYEAMFGKLAKWVVEIDDPTRVPEIVARAFRLAVSGRPGPVVISLPEDMLTEACPIPAIVSAQVAPVPMPTEVPAQIAAALRGARRPLVMLGGSGWTAEAAARIRAFAHQWKLPVACSFRRQDLFDNVDDQYIGHLSLGMSAALKRVVIEADVILAIGARLTDTLTDGYTLIEAPLPKQKLLHVYVDAGELGRVFTPALAVEASPVAAAEALVRLEAPALVPWEEWTAAARQAHLDFSQQPELSPDHRGVDMAAVVAHVSDVLPQDAILTNGAGNYAVWLHRFFRYRRNFTQLAPTCGAMGYGLPAAVAAGLRHPGRQVVCLAGDGCFMMYPQELATAAQFGSSFIVLLVNNGMYGTIRMHQEKHFPGRISATRLEGPDYVMLARSFGAYAEKVERTEDFAQAFQCARDAGGLALLELKTDPLQITPQARITA